MKRIDGEGGVVPSSSLLEGIVPRALMELLGVKESAGARGEVVVVECTYLQIYNEQVFLTQKFFEVDLQKSSLPKKRQLILHDY